MHLVDERVDGSTDDTTTCCNRTPFELPHDDDLSDDATLCDCLP
jgi:hypothetical protein